jgi:ribose transport system permease protein
LTVAAARLQARYPMLQLAALVALFAYGAATLDGFASRLSIYSMLVLAGYLGLAAVGQTIVILIGGLDLSIPGFILMGGTIVVQLAGASHWPFAAALLLAVLIALLAGSAAGWLCHRFAIPSLIVTLGVNAIVVGVIQGWVGGVLTGTPPGWLTKLASPAAHTLGVGFPPLALVWLAVAIVTGVVLYRTVTGRWIYATGANPRAADLALVRTRRVWVGAFAVSAACSTLVGVLPAGFAAGDQSVGDPYLFQSLTAVIVGGTAFGARGDYSRTVVGALLLTVLTTVLIGHGYSEATQQILFGVVILVVVWAYGRDRRLRDRV